MKKSLGLILAVTMLFTALTGLPAFAADAQVTVNGAPVELAFGPVDRDGGIALAFEDICAILGFAPSLDGVSTVAARGETIIRVEDKAADVKVNGKPVTISAPVSKVGDTLYLPIDALKAFDSTAAWVRSDSSLDITYDVMNGRYFQIVQHSSGKAFTLENGNLGDGVRVILGDADPADDKQVWKFVTRGDGRYAVTNKKALRSFDIPNGRSDVELNLIIYGITDGTNQWVRPVSRGDGTYLLQCAHDESLYLTERPDGVIAQNVLAGDDTQIFELREVPVTAAAVPNEVGGTMIAEHDELNGRYVTISLQDISAGETYRMATGLKLTDANSVPRTTSGTGADANVWKVTLRGNRRYQFTNKASGLALAVKDGALTLAEPDLSTGQMFTFKNNSLCSVSTGKYVSAAENGTVVLTDQAANIANIIAGLGMDAVSPYSEEKIGGKFYRIGIAGTEKVVSTADGSAENSARIVAADPSDSDIQLWDFVTQGSGSYILTNKASRRSMDIPGGSTEPGASVTQYDTNYGNNQIFELVPAGTDTYYLMNKNSELYMTEIDGVFSQEVMGHSGRQTFTLTEAGESDDRIIGAAATLFVLKGEDKVSNAKVQWGTFTNAARFDVYRSVDGGDYTLMASLTGKSIDDYDLEIGKSYSYDVYALDENGSLIDHAVTKPVVPYDLPADLKSSSNLEESGLDRPNSLYVDGVYYSFSAWGGGPNGGFGQLMMSTSADDVTYTEPVEVLNYQEILANETCQNFDTVRFESQNFIYNPVTNEFVFIAHLEADGGYGTAMTAFASGKPGERWTFHRAIRPEGGDTRDLNVYVDDDNKAYLIAAINVNADLALYELNESWTDVNRLVCIVNHNSWRELPSMMKVDGIYYLFTSGTAGWYPTQGMYNTAPTIDGPWSPLRTVGNTSTFSSQSGTVFRLKPGSDNYVMSTYRWMYFWQDAVVKRTTNRRYPVSVSNGFAFYDFYDELLYNWDNDDLVPVQNGRIVSQDMPVTSDSLLGDSALANDGNYQTIWTAGSLEGEDSQWPYVWEVDLGEVRSLSELQISWLIWNGSEPYYQYKVEGAVYGRDYTTLIDNTEGYTDYGFTVDQLSADARYLRITVENAKPRSHPNENNYPPQIYEVKVLAN